MKISSETVVSLVYDLSICDPGEDFEVVEVVTLEDPFIFLFGHSGLPEAFEKQLKGFEAGQEFEFELTPQSAFGLHSENDIQSFPLDFFKIDNGNIPEDMLEIGNFLPFTNDQGDRITGRIISIHNELVSVDFNHPLSGKNLHFKGKVISIRKAEPGEIAHGHVHGEGGINH
ncbi:MAG: FKBP-type peptidyl-prolyl cis-trans isomerase [Leadbetterella sp.]